MYIDPNTPLSQNKPVREFWSLGSVTTGVCVWGGGGSNMKYYTKLIFGFLFHSDNSKV